MMALRPVIVVRSSVQKPATSARRDSARIDRPATVGIVLTPCRTPAAAAPKQPFRPDRRPAIPAIEQRTKTVGRSPTVLVRRQWKRFLPLGARTEEVGCPRLRGVKLVAVQKERSRSPASPPSHRKLAEPRVF